MRWSIDTHRLGVLYPYHSWWRYTYLTRQHLSNPAALTLTVEDFNQENDTHADARPNSVPVNTQFESLLKFPEFDHGRDSMGNQNEETGLLIHKIHKDNPCADTTPYHYNQLLNR